MEENRMLTPGKKRTYNYAQHHTILRTGHILKHALKCFTGGKLQMSCSRLQAD
jgi:hypothetical protein